MGLLNYFTLDNLLVKVFETREEAGEEEAKDVANIVNKLLSQKEEVNIVFASAPSQNEFLDNFVKMNLPWSKIKAFHLDEYIGLPEDAPQRFSKYLHDKIFSKAPFKSINYIDGNAKDVQEECKRYENLLKKYPLDIACIGVGENGHIAFNEPSVADFNDKVLVKIVELEEKSRQQQVHDGCFSCMEEVPKYAITLTIPAIISAKYIFCIVPGKNKKEAIRDMLEGPIDTRCPASILRTHRNATLYLDKDSASLLRRF
ncbi:MAG: glucosamine-6-phosphate deaminase [Dictyoglomaceae bacterium]